MTTTNATPPPEAMKLPPKAVVNMMNGMMKTLLRSPLHGMLSAGLMLITFTGRKSGKQFTTPVTYMRDGDTITCFTRSPWWKNLQGGAPVTLRLQGRDRKGAAQVITDATAVAEATQTYLARNGGPKSAPRIGMTLDANREPTFEELLRAVQGRVLIRIQLEG